MTITVYTPCTFWLVTHIRDGKNGPATLVLATPVFHKANNEISFTKLQVIYKGASVILDLLGLLAILSYNK